MIKKLQALRAKKGFTLVELIVVIAIIGILAAILIPMMMGYVQQANITSADQNAAALKREVNNVLATLETKNCTVLGPTTGAKTYGVIGITIGAGTENKFGAEGAGTITLTGLTIAGKNPSGGEWSADSNKAVIEEFRTVFDTNLKDMAGGYGMVFMEGNAPVQAIWCSDESTISSMTAPITAWEKGNIGVIGGIVVGTNDKVQAEGSSVSNG